MKAKHLIHRYTASATAAAFSLLMATMAMAQDTAPATGDPPAESMSYFKMFFWADDFMGLLLIWVIILLSFIGMGYATFLLMKHRRREFIPEQTFEQVQAMLEDKQYRQAIDYVEADDSYLGKVLSGALNEASNGYSAMERAVEEVSDLEVSRILRPIELLNVMGNVGPMLGLFGTVYGMIVAFSKLVESGGKPDPVALAGGISTALVTTFWGLVVGIPALSAYALIRNKIDAYAAEGTVLAEELIRPFKPSGAKKKSSSAQTSSAASGAGMAGRPKATPKPA